MLASAADATTYTLKGVLEEARFGGPLGVAVNQSTNDVFVANHYEGPVGGKGIGVYEFDALGNMVPPEPFVRGSGDGYTSVAVDPESHDVSGYETFDQEIATFEPKGTEAPTKLRHFTVTGSGEKYVQIAAAGGYVYFPHQATEAEPIASVQVFAPNAEGEPATPERTIAPTGEHELDAPTGVAVDSERGNVYVVDAGKNSVGRVQVFGGFGNYESTLNEEGAQAVAVDPINGDVFVLDLNSGGGCEPLSAPCYRVVAYHYGESTSFAEFGAGTIGWDQEQADDLAVDDSSGNVYVTETAAHKVLIFQPGTPPEVTYPTPAVTGVNAAGATLHGDVNPRGNETSCHFEYGLTTAYEHSVPCQPEVVGEGTTAKPEASAITGLEGNTGYHFRLVATTVAGATVDGEDETFTTSQAPPTLLADAVMASDVTQSDAVFNATVNPQNLYTDYYFNYGVYPFDDSATCLPPGPVPYATAPVTAMPLAGSYSTAEELAGIALAPLDLDSQDVVLHPGMESRELEPNTAYRFQVVAENSAGLSCEAEATFVTLPPDPVADTGVASAITQSTAELAGSVTPGSTGPNSDTTWRFQYGISTSYEDAAPSPSGDAGAGTTEVPVDAPVAGLAPNTTYHYRLVASNTNDDPAADPSVAPQVADGGERSFTTPPAEPIAAQATGLTESGATLTGTVNPSGHALEYRFEYGTTSAYDQSTPAEGAGEGGEYTPVSTAVLALAPGTYHYRLVAIGLGGESYSPDATFTLYPATPEQTGNNPFSVGSSARAPFTTPPVLSAPSFPVIPVEPTTGGSTTTKTLTRAQKLAKALKQCKRENSKSKRKSCEKQARAKYGPTKVSKAKRASGNGGGK